MHIDKEQITKDTNYCSICWQEFTTLTEQEFQNLKEINQIAKKFLSVKYKYFFQRNKSDESILINDKGIIQ